MKPDETELLMDLTVFEMFLSMQCPRHTAKYLLFLNLSAKNTKYLASDSERTHRKNQGFHSKHLQRYHLFFVFLFVLAVENDCLVII